MTFGVLQLETLEIDGYVVGATTKVNVTFLVSVFISILSAVIVLLKPAISWNSYKFNELKLRSELFKFRTKVSI